jgi:N-acetylglutamate synthase-like GNAT family acetyltransferase
VPAFQRSGLGSCLTAALLERAAIDGIEKVVLLTSTARDFFARRFGFSEASRADYDEQLAGSPEWDLPRCSSAVCMSLDLKERK